MQARVKERALDAGRNAGWKSRAGRWQSSGARWLQDGLGVGQGLGAQYELPHLPHILPECKQRRRGAGRMNMKLEGLTEAESAGKIKNEEKAIFIRNHR